MVNMIAIAGINIRNEGDDIVVLVDTGLELVEVLRERNRFAEQSGTMDSTITALGIQDALVQKGEFTPPAKQTRIRYL